MSDNQNLRQRFDVAVVGGGPAGIGAAVAAARTGARTLLAERHEVLGGMCTAALVNNFCPAHLDHTRLIIGGVFDAGVVVDATGDAAALAAPHALVRDVDPALVRTRLLATGAILE